MRILVLGVGNILLTDEAIGVRIVEALEQRYILPDYVEILDGGTAGMELLGDMANRDHLIIADAIVSKKSAPGTMMILRDEEVPALFTNKISPHQLGLADVLSALRFTGEFPKLTLVGVIPESPEPHIGLTPTVEAMINLRLSRFWPRCANQAWKPSHGRRFMTEEIAGFQTSPKAQVQAAFEEIARRSMHDLSFLHPSMPVYVSDFTLFEGQWTGCVITPWMLSAVIFPGPDQPAAAQSE